MMNRRRFLKHASLGAGLLATGALPLDAFASHPPLKLTVLHTNDVHSRLESFPMDGSRYAGLGGVAARTAIISKIRMTEEHVLLLDAGDIFQGTPYFNLYKGEPEMKAMSMMGYDAATMGNHDFDAGLEGFAKQLFFANFPFVVANYEFTDTILENKTKPYHVFRRGPLKIGVFGIGIQLKGLVPDDAYGKTKHLEPIRITRNIVEVLRQKEKCDMVICLSHLGYEYESQKVSDLVLAKETQDIDLIIGGHTHTFLEEPILMKNKVGKDVVINQVGWAGIQLGRLDFYFNNKKMPALLKSQSVVVGR